MAGSAEVPTSRCLSQGFFTVNWHKHALKQKHHVYIKETYIYIYINIPVFFPTFHHIHLSQSHTHTHTSHTTSKNSSKPSRDIVGMAVSQTPHNFLWNCETSLHTVFFELVSLSILFCQLTATSVVKLSGAVACQTWQSFDARIVTALSHR